MTDTYNGLGPGEERTVKVKPRKDDNGHSIIEMTTARQGYEFRMRYRALCECGQRFSSRISPVEISYTHRRHKRKVLRETEWGQQPG